MSAGRYALLVATGAYDDRALSRLRSPARDAQALAEVLEDPRIGDFEVGTVVDGAHNQVTQAIERFFLDRRRDDLLLLHISCHGLKDNNGELHFAAADTDRRLLASTSVPALFVHRQMRLCRARSIVLLLDCCYSGAFLAGSKGDTTVHVKDELAGHGRAVLTATNRTEYAWEGERITELGPEPSRFTGVLVKGLSTGEADRDRDGAIGVHELYDYVYEELRGSGVRQSPQMWSELEHRVVVARSVRPALPRGPEDKGPFPTPSPPTRPVPAPASSGTPAPERPRPAPPVLLLVTEALAGLQCMEDARGRQQFATVLGEFLARRVDLRGVRQREDVVAIARAALNQEGGENALLSTVELFEGQRAAARLGHRLRPGGDSGVPRRGERPAPGPQARTGGGSVASGGGTGPQSDPATRPGEGPTVRDRGPAPASGPVVRPGVGPEVRGRPTGAVPRPAAPLAAAKGFRSGIGRLHGALSLLLLTRALCELPCMQTSQARTRFAAALAERSGRPVAVRGVRLREDVAVIAQAALSAPGGKRALVDVTRMLGGAQTGDTVGWLINAPG